MGENRTEPVETGQAAGRSEARRVTVTEAAWILETTVDALRKRVQRGTIPHERDEYGRVWIMVDADRTRQDTIGPRPDTDRPQYGPDALISEMRGRIEDLRVQLEAEPQGHTEARRLLAAALERIPPQLEPPRDEGESPTEAAADTESTEPLSGTPGPQERVSRPWVAEDVWWIGNLGNPKSGGRRAGAKPATGPPARGAPARQRTRDEKGTVEASRSRQTSRLAKLGNLA